MTNTITNVTRELLADLLGNDHDKRIMAERHLLAMLANAPSPAGVDGLEVVGYSYGNGILINDTTQPDNPMYTKLVRLSDAQAIIDGLRGEVAELQAMITNLSRAGIRMRTERDHQAQRIGELEGLLRACHTGLYPFDNRVLEREICTALSAGKKGD